MTTILVTYAQNIGYFQKQIRQSLEQGAVALESKEEILKRQFEEERRKVWNICEGKGKLVDRLV